MKKLSLMALGLTFSLLTFSSAAQAGPLEMQMFGWREVASDSASSAVGGAIGGAVGGAIRGGAIGAAAGAVGGAVTGAIDSVRNGRWDI